MDGVVVTPPHERREDEEAERGAQPCVSALGGQERAVRAVVEDDVRAQQEACRGRGEDEGERIGDPQQEVHPDRERQVRHDRRREIERAAANVRPRVRGECLLPGPVLDRRCCR